MSPIAEEVRALVLERERLRSARDFAGADALRARIEALGFRITDTATGSRVEPIAADSIERLPAARVGPRSEAGPATDFSVVWLDDGWPQDVLRGIASFRRFEPEGRSVQHVVIDTATEAPDAYLWPDEAELLALEAGTGWGAARNAGLRRSSGAIVIVADGSVEATGDVLEPIEQALADAETGVAGPFGIVTTDLREFTSSPGPEVDAIEGYVMAFRREVLDRAGGFDERFSFYRSADIELSFRIKDLGLRAMVVELPLRRHEHRRWATTPTSERDRLSKRNFNRFLERFRDRFDLCVGSPER
jgi:hypothetical protein